MIAVGEQTGAIDEMLNKIADFYEDEVDEATANLLALLEPIMILFLGIVIGAIAGWLGGALHSFALNIFENFAILTR